MLMAVRSCWPSWLRLWFGCSRTPRVPARRPRKLLLPLLEALEERCQPAVTITGFSAGLSANSFPQYIAAGQDGNLWFTEGGGGAMGRITPQGTVTEFSIPSSAAGCRVLLDRLVANAGGPDDSIEVMLIEQLTMAHYRTVQLQAQAAEAENVQAAAIYNTAAARLLCEFRKTALSLTLSRWLASLTSGWGRESPCLASSLPPMTNPSVRQRDASHIDPFTGHQYWEEEADADIYHIPSDLLSSGSARADSATGTEDSDGIYVLPNNERRYARVR